MAQFKPAPLCTRIMPSGKHCGSPALRGKRVCYHHSGKHREFTRERLLCRRLERLSTRLDGMKTADLLLTLQGQLSKLSKTLTRFPETACTLSHTLDRLEEITSLESILYDYVQHNQQFAAYLTGAIAESITSQQDVQNQQLAAEIQNGHLN
jgi:hypothetical protein